MPLNRRHVSTTLARRLACRTYPKDTQLNNLMYSGIRLQVQGVAQPCNLFTQSISLSNIQSSDLLTPTLRWIEPIHDGSEDPQKILLTDRYPIRITSFKQTLYLNLVELRRIELLTPCLQSRCSPS